jgi:transposase
MSRKFSDSERQGFVKGYLSSGVSIREYARTQGMSYSVLSKWVNQSKGLQPLQNTISSPPSPAFVELLSAKDDNFYHQVEINLASNIVIKIGKIKVDELVNLAKRL